MGCCSAKTSKDAPAGPGILQRDLQAFNQIKKQRAMPIMGEGDADLNSGLEGLQSPHDIFVEV